MGKNRPHDSILRHIAILRDVETCQVQQPMTGMFTKLVIALVPTQHMRACTYT